MHGSTFSSGLQPCRISYVRPVAGIFSQWSQARRTFPKRLVKTNTVYGHSEFTIRALSDSNSASKIKPLSSIAFAFSRRVTVSSWPPAGEEAKPGGPSVESSQAEFLRIWRAFSYSCMCRFFCQAGVRAWHTR